MYSTEDLEKVDSAITEITQGKGVAKITYPDGKSVEYSRTTLDELLKYRSLIQSEVSDNSGFTFFSFGGLS